MLEFQKLWDEALTFERFVDESAPQHRDMWQAVHRLARIPGWAHDAVPAGRTWRLIVLAEDWCGDAINSVPVIARWTETLPGVSLRVLRRDDNPQVMNQYLTNGSRSIPVVIALDGEFNELGWWGPRPRELQAWVMANKDVLPSAERYKEVRRWYAKDRGETTLREVMETMGIPQMATD